MKRVNRLSIGIFLILLLCIKACGIYSFTGASIPAGASTFQVNFFENQAGSRPGSTVEPGLDRDFTLALQDIIKALPQIYLKSERQTPSSGQQPARSNE